MDHKHYFQALNELGRKAVVGLRQLDERQSPLYKDYLEQRIHGEITEQGYKNLVKALQDSRQREIDRYMAAINSLEEEYYKAEEEHMTPSAGCMHSEDIKLLKNVNLSASEFNSMTEKYSDNPTMGRILEDYRKEHKIDTNWRYQDVEARKAIFSGACSSVVSIIGQSDKHCPDREGNVTRRAFAGYHKLQGSDPDELPVPAEETSEDAPMGISSVTLL